MTDETTTRTRRRVRSRDGDDEGTTGRRRRRTPTDADGAHSGEGATGEATSDAQSTPTRSGSEPGRRRVRRRSIGSASPADSDESTDRTPATDAAAAHDDGDRGDAVAAPDDGDREPATEGSTKVDRSTGDTDATESTVDDGSGSRRRSTSKGGAKKRRAKDDAPQDGSDANDGPAGDSNRGRRNKQDGTEATDDPAGDSNKGGQNDKGGQRKGGAKKRTTKSAKAAKDGGGKSGRNKSSSGGGPGDAGEQTTDGKADGDDSDDGARRTSGRQRGRKGRRRSSGGAPRGGVSEDARRSVTEGPPRRMLVSVGSQRTEVAVLEERDLVEHYVTRKESESYVGNIYLGRVQNVLPGMEAAFVDIGKGRNGVLYAGEVNYDDEDIESAAPRIEQALKPGQTVVVQVTKDPMGSKGARLTQQLSLAGRFCVLAIEDGTVGISRKLTDAERDRLRDTLRDLKPDGFGLIVRTAAAAATDAQLEADLKRLLSRWEQVQQRLVDAKPLTELYREPELAMRVIRDVYGPEFTELISDDEDLAGQIAEYLGEVSPELAATVQRYSGDAPLFSAYEITNQVRRALEKKVWLASGGYLIIEKTEAMWVIDVNTGKFVGDSNLEETVLRNNLEAAEEIARQLRLRDMGGIIVIDFVDMVLPVNRDEVLKRFRRELARDKTKSRVMEISKLGLVQMTRKNVSQGLTETFTKTCDCCEGRGAQIVDKALKR